MAVTGLNMGKYKDLNVHQIYSSSFPSLFCPCTTIRINSLSGATNISYLVVLSLMNLSSLWESKSLIVFLALPTSCGMSLASAFPIFNAKYPIIFASWCRSILLLRLRCSLSQFLARSYAFASC